MLLNCGVGEDSWESLGLQGDPTSPFWRRSVLGVFWKDWCWGWNSNTLGTSCEQLTHWKRPWCWEGLGAGGEGDDSRWDGWMASLTRWMSLGELRELVMDREACLACCDSWGCKESNTTERLKWTELKRTLRRIVCLLVFSCNWLFVIPWVGDHQAPLFMEFSSKNTGVSCYFFLLEIFLTHGIELESPLSHALQVDSLPTEPSINSQ